MEALFILIAIIIVVIVIRGYQRTKADEYIYRAKVKRMSVVELKLELNNFNNMTKHMPNLVRRNSVDGGWLTEIKSKAKIVNRELKARSQ